MSKRVVQWLWTAALLVLTVTAHGHRGHGIWSDIVWVGDRFELTHRLHLSDAILALRTLDKSANVDTLEGQAVLAIYVERNFGIDGVDTPKTLTTLGAEIDDDFFYVYQEWVTALPKSMPSFYSTVLEDILADTHSWIHYETPDTQQTLELSKNP